MLENEVWGQQFKAKRLSYGVSRSKLSSIIGLTINQLEYIEQGCKKLTDEERQALLTELERFNPDNPLNVMFDYVRIRFTGLETQEIVENIMGISFKHFLHEDYGFYGYEEQYYLGDIQLMYSSNSEMGILLELKGRGCRQFESYLQAQGKSWYEFFVAAKLHDCVFKRIDLAVNDLVGLLDIPYLIGKCERDECVSLFRNCVSFRSHELTRKNVVGMGDTLNLGSRSSEIHFCIYRKDYEQYQKFGINIDDVEVKNRFEIRLRNDRATIAIDDYLKNNDVKNLVFGIINRYVRFVDMDSDGNIHRKDLDSKWEMFLNGCSEKIKLTLKPEPYTFDKSLNWLKKQVAPTLKTAMFLDEMNGTDIVDKILENAKIPEKLEAVIRDNSTSIYDMIKINEFLKESEN